MGWNGQRECEKEMLWGLPSRDADIFQIPLLKSETAIIDRPCLLLANEFGLVKRGKTIYAASLISVEPFFCIAAVLRPSHRLSPERFAVPHVPASDDLPPPKDRHLDVVRHGGWFYWLVGAWGTDM